MILFLKHITGLLRLSLASEEQILGQTDPGSIIEPDPIRFSFETPGWYILFFLLIIISLFLIFKWIKKYRKNAYRRNAVKNINKLAQNNLDELLIILRLTAIETYGRENIAGLYGKDWISFLDSKVKNPLFENYETVVEEFTYKEIVPKNAQIQEFTLNTKKWIKNHVA